MPLLRFFRSSVGLKYLMALSGVILFGFVFVHMVGNLQIFLGRNQLNAYAYFLQSQPEFLWLFRLALFGAVMLHIGAGLLLSYDNAKARGPVSYSANSATRSSLASRTMAVSGLVVLAFIVFHILHFTVGVIDPKAYAHYEPSGRHDVYNVVVSSFSTPWIAWFYIISMALLCTHLSHGVQSFFRSLGLSNKNYLPMQVWFARGFSALIFIGMTAIPLSVLLGFIRFVQS